MGLIIRQDDRSFPSPLSGSVSCFAIGRIDFGEKKKIPANQPIPLKGFEVVNPHRHNAESTGKSPKRKKPAKSGAIGIPYLGL
jgi:hypothetical protein